MRTHDEESLRSPKTGHIRERENDPNALDVAVAHRAVADHRPDTLGTRSVMHLQREAGNSSVGSLLQEEKSPVLDVVGRGGGQALDKDTRAHMEGAMGHDFSDVRVHSGGEAAKSAVSVQASAYTVGNDIVLGNSIDTGSDAGKRTLAHELTHVVQQRSGAVDGTPQAGGISVSDPSDRFEQAAEANADRVMATGHEGHDHGSHADGDTASAAAAVQRQEEPPEEDAGVQRQVVQRQEEPPEEDAGVQRQVVQRQEEPMEEDSAVQRQVVQRQEEPPEEDSAVQRQEEPPEEDSAVQRQVVQRQEEPPEEDHG